MEQHRIIPFYQTYPMSPYPMPYLPPYAISGNGYVPLYMAQETGMREDLQYLQEMFPEMSRRYAAKIASVVDRLDYKGSMIYDEYPDRIRLQRLAHDIVLMIEKEEAEAASNEEAAPNGEAASNGETAQASPELRYREELIYVLLCYEIAKRRHGAGMDLSKFYGISEARV